MRKGPLTKKDKQYIEKFYGKVHIEKIAKHVERSVEFVEKYIEKVKAEEATQIAEQEAEQPKPQTALDFMGRKPERGVVVMTEVASMRADETRAKRGKNPPSGRYKDCIHIIRKDVE